MNTIKNSPHVHKEIHVDKNGHRVVKYVNNEEAPKQKKIKRTSKAMIKPMVYNTFDDHTLTPQEIKLNKKSPFLTMTKNEIKNIYDARPIDAVRKNAEDWMARFVFRIMGDARYIKEENKAYISPDHYSILYNFTSLSPYAKSILSKKIPVAKLSESEEANILQETAIRMNKLVYGVDLKKSEFECREILKSIPPRKNGIELDNEGKMTFSEKTDNSINGNPDDKTDPANKVIWGFLANTLVNVAKEVVFGKNRGGDKMGHKKDNQFIEDISLEDMQYGDKNYNTPQSPSAEDQYFNEEDAKESISRYDETKRLKEEAEAEMDRLQSKSPVREVGEQIIDAKRISGEMKKRNKFIWNLYLNNMQDSGSPNHNSIYEALINNGFHNVSKDTSRQVIKNITSQLEQSKWANLLPGKEDKDVTHTPQAEEENDNNASRLYSDPLSLLLTGKTVTPVISQEYKKQLEEDGKPIPKIIPLTTLPSFNKQAYASLKSSHLTIENKNDNSFNSYTDRGNVRVMYSANDSKSSRTNYLTFYKRFADSDGNTTKIFVYTKKIVEKLSTPKKKDKESKKPASKKKPVAKKKSVSKKKAVAKKKSKIEKGKIWQGFVSRIKRKK